MHALIRNKRFQLWYWLTGCLAGLFVLFLLFPARGTGDVELYQSLIERFSTGGLPALTECITQTCPPAHLWNYPPLYLFIFFAGQFVNGNSLPSFILHKVLIAVFYGITLLLIASLATTTRPNSPLSAAHRAIRAIFLGLTGISVLINTLGLGYIDIFTFPFIILTFYFLSKRAYFAAGFFYAGACLVKFLPILLVPFFLLFLLRQGIPSFLRFFLGMGGLITVVALASWGSDIVPVSLRILTALTQDPYFSAAPNIPLLYTMLFPHSINGLPEGLLLYLTETTTTPFISLLYQIFKILYFWYYAWVFYQYSQAKKNPSSIASLLVASVYAYLGYFFIATGVHENHLMIGVYCALLLAVMFPYKRFGALYRRVDIASSISMMLYYGVSGTPFFPVALHTIALPITVSSLLIIFFFLQITAIRQDIAETHD